MGSDQLTGTLLPRGDPKCSERCICATACRLSLYLQKEFPDAPSRSSIGGGEEEVGTVERQELGGGGTVPALPIHPSTISLIRPLRRSAAAFRRTRYGFICKLDAFGANSHILRTRMRADR